MRSLVVLKPTTSSQELVEELPDQYFERIDQTLKQKEQFVINFFYDLMIKNQERIFVIWGEWGPLDRLKGSYLNLKHLIEVILFQKLECALIDIGDTQEIELFKGENTLRIPLSRMENCMTLNNRYINILKNQRAWSHFFSDRKSTPSIRSTSFESFRFNYILEDNFPRAQIVQQIIMKIAMRTMCIGDSLESYENSMRIIIAILGDVQEDQGFSNLKKPDQKLLRDLAIHVTSENFSQLLYSELALNPSKHIRTEEK